jgi:hypothetical protein
MEEKIEGSCGKRTYADVTTVSASVIFESPVFAWLAQSVEKCFA